MSSANPSRANPKGDLMVLAASLGLGEVHFDTEQSGPAHAPHFVALVQIGAHEWTGEGRSKRDAEREAALTAMRQLQSASAAEHMPLPLYAEVLSQALLVAHERVPVDAGVDEVQRLTLQLYSGLLRGLGISGR